MKLINIINKKRITTLLLAAVVLLTVGKVKAQQQFSFTQYMDNLTPFNPAYSLLDKAGSVNALARKQWVGIDGAPTTFLVNASLPLESIGAAVGLVLLNDKFAVERQTEVNAYFAKSIQFSIFAHIWHRTNTTQ